MADFCAQIKSQDPLAASICEVIANSSPLVGPTYFDQGDFSIDFEDSLGPRAYWTGSDEFVSPAEVYTVFFEKIDSSSPVIPSLFSTVIEENQIDIPFVLDDGDELTTFDEDVRLAVREEIDSIHGTLVLEGYSLEDAYYKEFMAKQLCSFILEKYNMTYNNDHLGAYTALEALEKGEANCLEFTFILYSVFKMAGLQPKFVEIIKDEPHMVLSLDVEKEFPGKTIHIDPALKRIIYDASEESNSIPIPLSVAIAYHHYNQATTVTDEEYLNPQNFEMLENAYATAISYAPKHWRFHYGIATLYARHEKFEEAIESYKVAIDLKKDETILYEHLAIVESLQKSRTRSQTEATKQQSRGLFKNQ